MASSKVHPYSYYFLLTVLPMFTCFVGLLWTINWTIIASISYIVSYLLVYLLGVSIFYHRYWSHKQFTPNIFICKFFTIIGLLGMVGGPTFYAIIHRTHHQHVDTELDPHSPKDGRFHAFMGWMFTAHTKLKLNKFIIKDLFREENKWMLTVEKFQIQIIWIIPLLIFLMNPAVALGLIAAMFTAYFIEMSVNGFLHSSKRSSIRDAPYILSWLTAGAMKHNFHHSSKQGTVSKEDPGYFLVTLLDTS